MIADRSAQFGNMPSLGVPVAFLGVPAEPSAAPAP